MVGRPLVPVGEYIARRYKKLKILPPPKIRSRQCEYLDEQTYDICFKSALAVPLVLAIETYWFCQEHYKLMVKAKLVLK